jgi:hypothetical protein
LATPEQQARTEIDRLLAAAGWALQDFKAALYVRAFQRELITLKLAVRDIEAHRALLVDLLRKCEQLSRREG